MQYVNRIALEALYRRNSAELTKADLALALATDDYGAYRAKGGILDSGIAFAILKATKMGDNI